MAQKVPFSCRYFDGAEVMLGPYEASQMCRAFAEQLCDAYLFCAILYLLRGIYMSHL